MPMTIQGVNNIEKCLNAIKTISVIFYRYGQLKVWLYNDKNKKNLI